MIERRAFLGTFVALATPLAAIAQQPAGTMHHVGVFTGSGARADDPIMVAFREALRDRGYSEGGNIRFTYRGPVVGKDDVDAGTANELVRLKVDVIVATTNLAIRAAKAATESIPIPIVFIAVDPVENGFVASLAKPGGNLTGFTWVGDGFTEKQLQLLKEMVPRAKRMAILNSPDTTSARRERDFRDSQAAADKLGLKLQWLEAHTPDDIERLFAAATAKNTRVDGMHVYGHPFLHRNRERIMAQAKARRVPAMYMYWDTVRLGGLMSFGPDFVDEFRRLAGPVDRILKGAQPADIPVEEPTRYVLAINLKTARELGLTVPHSLRVRADRLFE